MYLNIAVILIILGLGGLWLSRGFYSAIINLIAVVLAGGVAFAVWEPLAYKILEGTSDRSFLQGTAWSIALAGPFILSLGLFRLIMDVILRANVKVNPAVNYAGGAICGLLAGLVSAGIGVIAVGFLRMDAGLWQTDDSDPSSGYLNMEYNSNGSMQVGKGLWIPVDDMVASFYSSLSRTTFRGGSDNLATLYPDLVYVPTSLRYNHGMGKGRNTTRPKDFDLLGRYTVGDGKNLKTSDLLGDKWMPSEQRVTLFDKIDGSDAVPNGSHLEGFILRFNSSAKELGGDAKVAVGNAQLRLLATNSTTGQTITLFPIAVAAQGEADKPAFQRFRYDGKDIFIASVGGASEAYFGFDFVMPPGFAPEYLYVKNIRVALGDSAEKKLKPIVFATPADRDEAISGARLLGSKANEPMDTTSTQVLRYDSTSASQFPIVVTGSPGQVLNKMVVRMDMDDQNKITNGDQQFSEEELKNFATEKALRVDSFITTPDTVNVQVDVSISSAACWLNHPKAALEDDKPAILVDANGVHYEPVGFIYSDKSSGLTRIRFTPGAPIHALKDLPTVSRSKPTDTLKLIYRVSKGVRVQYFGVGTQAVIEVKPPMEIKGF